MEYIDGRQNVIADTLSPTNEESPSPASEQSLLLTDDSNSIPVLLTIIMYHPTVSTSHILPTTANMPCDTPSRRMLNMSDRYKDRIEYDSEDCKLQMNLGSDSNRRVCSISQQLSAETALARRTPTNITNEQVNHIQHDERDRRWTEFRNRMLIQEEQEAANTLQGEAT